MAGWGAFTWGKFSPFWAIQDIAPAGAFSEADALPSAATYTEEDSVPSPATYTEESTVQPVPLWATEDG